MKRCLRLGLEKDTYKVVRQNIIDMILATEMTKHFEHLAKFVSVCNKPTAVDEAPADGLVSGNARLGVYATRPDLLLLFTVCWVFFFPPPRRLPAK